MLGCHLFSGAFIIVLIIPIAHKIKDLVLVCFFHYTTLRIPDKSKTRPSVSLALSSVCALACQYKLGPFPPQSNKLPILESPLISGHLKSSVRPQCLLSTVQLQWR